jgi:restriction system protein
MQNKHESIAKRAWVIRAGENGSAHELFIKYGLIVLQGQQMGDLRRLPETREGFHSAYELRHPHDSRKAIGGIGGKFFRFIHEMKVGDYVIYPCLIDT